MENLIDILQPNDPLLMTLGQMFASVGMGKQAVEAFLKNNKISNAIGKIFGAKIQIFHVPLKSTFQNWIFQVD